MHNENEQFSFLMLSPLVNCTALTMKTSNSSKQRNGDSIASHRAMMKDTVEKERSPPDRDRVSFESFLEPLSTLTCRETQRGRAGFKDYVRLAIMKTSSPDTIFKRAHSATMRTSHVRCTLILPPQTNFPPKSQLTI